MNKRLIVPFITMFSILIVTVFATWIIINNSISHLPSEHFPFEVDFEQIKAYTSETQEIDLSGYYLEENELKVEYYKVIQVDSKYSLEQMVDELPKNKGIYLTKVYENVEDEEGNISLQQIFTIKFVIEPKIVNITWNGPEQDDLVFSAEKKSLSLSTEDICENDKSLVEVGFQYIIGDGIDAGLQKAEAIITGSDNYVLNNQFYSYTITPKVISTIDWGSTNFTYNGSQQLPTATFELLANDKSENNQVNVELVNDTNSINVKLGYKAKAVSLKNNNYTLEKPIETTFNINYLNVEIKDDIYEYDYFSSSWTDLETKFLDDTNGIKFVDSNNDDIGSWILKKFTINSMNDGVNKFGTLDEGDKDIYQIPTNLIGSTYLVYISVNDDNINLVGNFFVCKYKTAKIGDEYYTIEDAIKTASGTDTIILVGSNTGTYVTTSFSSLPSALTGYNEDSYYTLKGKLRVPFYDVDMDFHGSGGLTEVKYKDFLKSSDGCETIAISDVKDIVYSVLNIPTNKNLIIESGGTLNVGALIDTYGSVYNRGVIMNEGTITANNGSKIKSYGYIKGNEGKIIANSGSKIIDVFRIYDWVGGSYASGLNSNNIFPINAYSIHNISCETKIYAGSRYDSFWNIKFANALYQGFQRGYENDDIDKDTNIKIIGSNGMFNLNNGYIIKKTSNAINVSTRDSGKLLELSGSNQISGQRDNIEIYGSCNDNKVSVDLKAGATNFTIESKLEMPLPLGYMNVSICKKDDCVGDLTLSATSYKFYPGSFIDIRNGAKLTISKGVTLNMFDKEKAIVDQSGASKKFITESGGLCVDKNDAYIKVDGTLEVKANANLGGQIITSASTGKFIMNGNITATISYRDSSENIKTTTNKTLIKRYDQVNKQPSLNYSTPIIDNENLDNNTYYATAGAWEKASATIKFNLNGGTGNLSDEYLSNINSGSERGYDLTEDYLLKFVPTRTGYTFEGWFLDKACTISAIDVTLYTDVTLYAKWEIKEITLTFVDGNETDGYVIIATITQNYGTPITIPDDPEKTGYIFAGWTPQVPDLVPDKPVTYVAKWIDEGAEIFQITFETDGGSTVSPIKAPAGMDITAPVNPTKEGYKFIGWDQTIPDKMPDQNITIKALWKVNEYTITFVTNCSTKIDPITKDYGLEITAPTISNTGYKLIGWYTDYDCTGDPYEFTTMEACDITLYAKWDAIKYIVKFDGNGHTEGTMTDQPFIYDESQELYVNGFKKEGNTFKGWSTTPDGNLEYNDGQTVNNLSSTDGETVRLYAVWEDGGCFASGTFINMYDGTVKKVEDLVFGDKVLVFNHNTGKVDVSIITINVHDYMNYDYYDVLVMSFSDGTTISIINDHGFFDLTEGKYVAISLTNYEDYIGHEFYKINSNFESAKVEFVDAHIEKRYCGMYSPFTYEHLNMFAEGLLTLSGEVVDLYNAFEFAEDASYDKQKMIMDIEKYGLYTYEDFKDYATKEEFDAFNAKYFKVAVGKGYITYEDVIRYIRTYLR